MTRIVPADVRGDSPDTKRRPLVVVYDPFFEVNWSFETERRVLAAEDVRLVLPASRDEAPATVRDADVVVVTHGPFGADLIGSLRRCVGIVCYSVGTDYVDLAAAAAAGIPVRNLPNWCTDEVSDHAVALLLAAERRLRELDAAARGWQAAEVWKLVQPIRRLRGQTLGIVGAGRIGRAVARKARVFGFRTLAYDPHLDTTGDPDLPLASLDRVLSESDALVLCADLNETSRNMIGREAVALMRPGVILVNVARGGLVDEVALAEGLRTGRVGYAALDVRQPEPPDPTADPLADLPNVLLTPHVGAASIQARQDLHRAAAEATLELLAGAGRIPRPSHEENLAP